MDKWTKAILIGLLWWGGLMQALAEGQAATNAPATVTASTRDSVTNASSVVLQEAAAARAKEESLRAYLRLQEQLHTALLAIQQSRMEASAEAQTNVGAMMSRLEAFEKELAEQRAAQVRSTQETNRLTLFAAAGIFLVGVLALVITAIVQARGVNRLAEIAVGVGRGTPGFPDAIPLALENGGHRWLLGHGNGETNPEGGRLQSTIRQLETRIRQIEVSAEPAAEIQITNPGPTATSSRDVLLAKVQTLFNLGQPQAALTALDDVIAREPADAVWHLKKGLALERLKRFDLALDEFDRAIALDRGCTQAYLSKGSVLNQQARYQEALACYELSLEHQARAKSAPASV